MLFLKAEIGIGSHDVNKKDYDSSTFAQLIFGGPECRLQTCSCLTTEWFDSTWGATFNVFGDLFSNCTRTPSNPLNHFDDVIVSRSFSYMTESCLLTPFMEKIHFDFLMVGVRIGDRKESYTAVHIIVSQI